MGRIAQQVSALSGVTSTKTSDKVEIAFASQITVQFLCAGHTSGNGVFSIDVSNDGINWNTGIYFQDAGSANSTTWINSKTLNANGSASAQIVPGYRYMRVVCAVTTDGSYSAIINMMG